MSEKEMGGILVMLVPQIVKEIIVNEKISEGEATEALYDSTLYAALEDEKTKLWHLSAKALYELFSQERQFGKIDFPEEA